MSLINFLNPKLKPSVECDAVCEDGFNASNLIADDAEQLARGFMGFSVSKPPVEIVFEFPKAIDLKVIKLWHTHGSLRSTAFEVHSKSEGIWERVANVRDLDKGIDSVTFCYQSDYNSRSNAEYAAALLQSEKAFFFKTAHKILGNTQTVKIIIRATHKCAPVLRKVQIWGLPARSLDKADRELMKTIWNEIMHPYGQRDEQHEHNGGQRSPSRCLPELNAHSTLKIPEEFLDAITWELMIFPTVLPSGKVVDQSTIDKHSEEEAKWGRLPSDPFTGLEFTSQRKAILNLALKARIEKFLMENAEHFKTVPRSLGSSRVRRSRNRHASQFAILNQSNHRSSTSNYTTTTATVGTYSVLSAATPASPAITYKSLNAASASSATATLASSASSAPIASPLPAKRARLSAELTTPLFTSTATQTSATATASYARSAVNNNHHHRHHHHATAAATVSATTAYSSTAGIEDALQAALQKMTRYTSASSTATGDVDVSLISCCIRCKSDDFAYEIKTCKHLVCRDCLVHLSKSFVCSCQISFRNADVERYHKL